MALSDSEIQSLRIALGYGAITTGAYPYTPDGFYEVFYGVVAPNLQTAAMTTSVTAVAGIGIATIVVASATDIVARAKLIVDVGPDEETVTVRAVSGTSVSAVFAKTHTAGPYPVAIASGESMLRSLLTAADDARTKLVSTTAIGVAGLKRAEDIEWYQEGSGGVAGGIAGAQLRAYHQIIGQISDLVRVKPRWESERACGQLETY